MEALNKEECAKNKLDGLRAQLSQLKADADKIKQPAEKLKALYKDRDNLLCKFIVSPLSCFMVKSSKICNW